MQQFVEVLLALGVVAATGALSFAAIILVYRLCCDASGGRTGRLLGASTSESRDFPR